MWYCQSYETPINYTASFEFLKTQDIDAVHKINKNYQLYMYLFQCFACIHNMA